MDLSEDDHSWHVFFREQRNRKKHLRHWQWNVEGLHRMYVI